MSLSIYAVSSNSAAYDAAPAPNQPAKPTEADQIKQLANQGRSAQSIATAVGLPESLVATELGDTTGKNTSASQATAVLSLSARLSVRA